MLSARERFFSRERRAGARRSRGACPWAENPFAKRVKAESTGMSLLPAMRDGSVFVNKFLIRERRFLIRVFSCSFVVSKHLRLSAKSAGETFFARSRGTFPRDPAGIFLLAGTPGKRFHCASFLARRGLPELVSRFKSKNEPRLSNVSRGPAAAKYGALKS